MTRWLRTGLAVLGTVLVIAVMVRLSVWQWDRARASGSLTNYSYAVEWLVFAGLTVVAVVRLVVEGRRADAARQRADDEPDATASTGALMPLVGPPLSPGEQLQEVTWLRLRRRLGLGR